MMTGNIRLINDWCMRNVSRALANKCPICGPVDEMNTIFLFIIIIFNKGTTLIRDDFQEGPLAQHLGQELKMIFPADPHCP